jgi:hypothetical protein
LLANAVTACCHDAPAVNAAVLWAGSLDAHYLRAFRVLRACTLALSFNAAALRTRRSETQDEWALAIVLASKSTCAVIDFGNACQAEQALILIGLIVSPANTSTILKAVFLFTCAALATIHEVTNNIHHAVCPTPVCIVLAIRVGLTAVPLELDFPCPVGFQVGEVLA